MCIIDFTTHCKEKVWSSDGRRYFKKFRCAFCGKCFSKKRSFSIVDGGKSCEECDETEIREARK